MWPSSKQQVSRCPTKRRRPCCCEIRTRYLELHRSSSKPQAISIGRRSSYYTWAAVIHENADIITKDPIDESITQMVRSRAIRHDDRPTQADSPYAEGRGDRDPVRMRDVDSQRETLRQAPNCASPSPPVNHCFPALRTYRSHHLLVCQGPQEDTIGEHRTTIRKRRLFFAGPLARQHEGRLLISQRVMFATMAGGENPGPGGKPKTWHKA